MYIHVKEIRKEIFYLTRHSTHINGYLASDMVMDRSDSDTTVEKSLDKSTMRNRPTIHRTMSGRSAMELHLYGLSLLTKTWVLKTTLHVLSVFLIK